MAESSSRIEWFIHDGEREIGPLGEVELRKRLKRGKREKLRVRQNEGPWYPAIDVIRKFRELAENGIYIKLATVAGPYTAEKAYALLSELSLDGILAKIGLHGQWVPAARLHAKLQKAIDKSSAPANETVPIDQGATLADSDDEIISSDDDDIIPLDPIDGDAGDDVFDLAGNASAPLLDPVDDLDSIPIVEPLDDDPIPVVQPMVGEQIPVVQPLGPGSTPAVQPIEVQPIAVQPIAVQPIAVQPIEVQPVQVQPVQVQPVQVQPIEVQPMRVQPVQVQPVPVQPVPVQPIQQKQASQLTHWCACGREVRVMPQHAGMTMQCPACKRTFVAGGRSAGR